MQSNPIVVDGVLFATTPTMKVVAVNAATGQEIWRFDPSGGSGARTRFRHRGVTVHADRVFVTYRNFLCALDKTTGQPIASFGERRPHRSARGSRPAGRRPQRERQHAGRGLRGSADPAEQRAGNAAGDARPHPRVRREDRAGSAGSSTRFRSRENSATTPGRRTPTSCPAAPTRGRASPSIAKLGMVFAATGSASFDFYGVNRHGDNLFANCVLALDARTGKRIWHFQGIKHDVWDWDFPAPPSLVTVTRDGRARSTRSRRSPSSATSSCSIAAPARRSSRSRSAGAAVGDRRRAARRNAAAAD